MCVCVCVCVCVHKHLPIAGYLHPQNSSSKITESIKENSQNVVNPYPDFFSLILLLKNEGEDPHSLHQDIIYFIDDFLNIILFMYRFSPFVATTAKFWVLSMQFNCSFH
jgi:hypothetical protein